jgi:putative acetyltransferase
MIKLKRTTSTSIDFIELTKQLDKELKLIYGESQVEFDQYNIINDLSTVVIAFINEKPVGCGCFKQYNERSVELKRMYVDSKIRSKGVGAAILTELEQWAKELNYNYVVLETGTKQPFAVRLYEKMGYQQISNFDPYQGNELSICFSKTL